MQSDAGAAVQDLVDMEDTVSAEEFLKLQWCLLSSYFIFKVLALT